jgi:hypothetical protein
MGKKFGLEKSRGDSLKSAHSTFFMETFKDLLLHNTIYNIMKDGAPSTNRNILKRKLF